MIILIKKRLKYFLGKKLNEKYLKLFLKYQSFTMIDKSHFIDNLILAEKVKSLSGDIVECGVWRGGMIAAISETLGNNKKYHLFDSFEGLPKAKEIDGASATDWQQNISGDFYYDNCKAEIDFAEKAMKLSGATYQCHKGWFSDTLPQNKIEKISLLRLDGDWYDSTLICLQFLFPKVEKNGIIIIDDYYTWDGCSRAVHDYLSNIKSISRISIFKGIAYIQKID